MSMFEIKKKKRKLEKRRVLGKNKKINYKHESCISICQNLRRKIYGLYPTHSYTVQTNKDRRAKKNNNP